MIRPEEVTSRLATTFSIGKPGPWTREELQPLIDLLFDFAEQQAAFHAKVNEGPTTIDGFPIYPGMEVYFYDDVLTVDDNCRTASNDDGGVAVDECYADPEKARAAK